MSGEKETAVGDGEDWVEAEIEGELAGLAHLTLEDLEDLEEENNGGYHGNKEVCKHCMTEFHLGSRVGIM